MVMCTFTNTELLQEWQAAIRQEEKCLRLTRVQVWATFGVQEELWELQWILSLRLAQPRLIQSTPPTFHSHP